MTIDERTRLGILIPAWHKKLLYLWAGLKGTSPTNLAGNIIQARIEANLDQIMLMADSRAKDLGITTEEFIDRIVGNNSDSDD